MLDKLKVVNIYVDSFNLYHGLLERGPGGRAPDKESGRRWLNLVSVSKAMSDKHFGEKKSKIGKVYLFTAPVESAPEDKQMPRRQESLFRALKHAGVEIVFGHFSKHIRSMKAVHPSELKSENFNSWIEVWGKEEKRSDVNLAAYMVRDAAKGKMDAAILISHDTDFKGAVDIVRKDFDKEVYIVNLEGNELPPALRRAGSGVLELTDSLVKNHQFPDKIPGTTIHKPAKW